ncbi:S1C family serine protease [Caulobacter sp. UNC279MFTsu5.1]|uniref:S1C family serine protease n=1 Tax=Caulobacter sp. UNC279MFTsu5.1 TaxID=1502775 RepID=UPI0008EE6ABF|nr:S1C family serine protease [Caulobacter sp. UNC279MFTsu5.1]SFK20388.1 serine protease, S1-C subfamily, contains C-terminal PDZ domain [Caulobacter sp. UNC279MFTsu5.1]
MPSPFQGHEVEARLRPAASAYPFDLDRALSSVVALEAQVPADAFTARILGTERLGNGVVISENGLVLTMAYLITEASQVVLTLNDGRQVQAHVLGFDGQTGLGLVQALEPLGLPALRLGASKVLDAGSPVVIAGAGGRAHAAAGRVLTRMPFAGYWEYLLDEAIITEPAHPHWSGAALIGAQGELVGVGSLSLAGQSPDGRAKPMNMFVPAELLPPILDDLARGKPAHPPRPWLGVFAQETESHVVLVGVSPASPAARAELRAGDLILAVAGDEVSDLAEFYTALWDQGPAGVTVPLRIQREQDVFEVEIRSVDRNALLKKPRLN